MSAPQYRSRTDPGDVVEAVQFIEFNPRTHWHVNKGHPVAVDLADRYWVLTEVGPFLIADGDYVVQRPPSALQPNAPKREVVPAALFEARYESIEVAAASRHPLDRDGDGRPGGSLPAAQRLDPELVARAQALGVAIDKRWGNETLCQRIKDAEAAA